MGNSELLVRRFAAANLRAEVIERDRVPSGITFFPTGVDSREVFQLAIAGKGREERFRIWPGAADNRVEVEGVDPALRQLVLLVREAPREFLQVLQKSPSFSLTGLTVVREDRTRVWIARRAPAQKRHFLCGRDERQLFVCQLPRAVTTVRDAHAALRAPEVARTAADEVVRQGEWFFVPATGAELDALDAALRAGRTAVRPRSALGPGGKPHVADERVVVPAAPPGSGLRPAFVLARGRVRHPDHATVRLARWCKVVRNAEPLANDGLARMAGVNWVD